MAIIKPFKGVRPTRDKAALATSRSYEAYTKQELNFVLKYNPFSFLHIIKPGYDSNTQLTGKIRFETIHNSFENFKKEGIYTQDVKPCYYLHQKSFETNVFWGIIAIAHVSDYQNNIIKKHEETLKEREELFGNYLEIVGFNAEPVLLTYPKNQFLEKIYKKYCVSRAEYEFSTHTKRLHKFWVINNSDDIENIEREFQKMDALYIADGHHRTASSNFLANKLRIQNKNHNGTEPYNFFMAYLIADVNLKISAFNRFVKDLNGHSKNEFLELLSENFTITNKGKKQYKPSKKHHFSMYLDGEYYALYLKKSVPITDALSNLDTQLLFENILKPILGINDLKTDQRIKVLPAIYSTNQLKKVVDSGDFKVAFGMISVTVEELKSVVNEGLQMPPKSTYIEPKLRSGLTIYELFN